MSEPLEGIIVEGCPAIAALCHCYLDGEHEIHSCACGGQWKGTEPDITVVTLPDLGSLLFGGLL